MSIIQIRKRDGRLVPFDGAKISEAIYRAAVSVGGEDRALADELGGVVKVLLEREFRDRVPGIEDIQDLVEKVLIETGHAKTAKAYILYRDRRARIRETLSVRKERPALEGPRVESASRSEVRPWNKARIVDALVAEADLPRPEAEEVAREVEDRIFRAGLQKLSTSLVRALVDNVLLERGLENRLARQRSIGLPKFDVREILKGKGVAPTGRSPSARDASARIAGAILGAHNLEEAFSPEVLEAHREGRIDLGDAASIAPSRLRTIPLKTLLAPEANASWARPPRVPGDLPSMLRAILDAVEALGAAGVPAVAIPLLDAFLSPWAESAERRDVSRFASGLLDGLERICRLGGPRAEIHLCASMPADVRALPACGTGGAPLPKPYGACEESARSLARAILAAYGERNAAERALDAPRVVLRVAPEDLERADSLALVEYAAVIVEDNGGPIFSLAGIRSAGIPGLPSPSGEGFPLWDRPVSVLEGVSLNLPLAALEAGGEEGRLYEALESRLSLATRALTERRAFLREIGLSASGVAPAALEVFPVALVGLPECAAALLGPGPEAARASRILAFLSAQAKTAAAGAASGVLRSGERTAVAARFARTLRDRGSISSVSRGILREGDPEWLAAAPRLAPFLSEGPVRRVRSSAEPVDREIVQGMLQSLLRSGGFRGLAVLPEGSICHGCRDFVPEGRACPRCGPGAATSVPELEFE